MIMPHDPTQADRVTQPPATDRGAMAEVAVTGGTALRFAESLVTRFCHDLAGALNTLSNALEIANEELGAGNEALAIAVEGSAALTARLRVLRAAWGGGLGPMNMPDLVALTEGLPSFRRISIRTDRVAEPGVFATPVARTLLNVLMLAAESLPHGGEISLSGTAKDGIIVMIAGRAATWPAGLPALLVARENAWSNIDDPRRLGAALTVLLAAADSVSLSILMGGPAGQPPPLVIRANGASATNASGVS